MKSKTEKQVWNGSGRHLKTVSRIQIRLSKAKHGLGILLTAVLLAPPVYCRDNPNKSNENRILEAYELRTNGKADQAEALLTELLKQDSTNAFACFELARTQYHLFLGKEPFSPGEWEKVKSTFQQAMKLAPGNAIYSFYYAYSCFFNAFIGMMMQKPDVAGEVKQACQAFESVLDLKPHCHEASLYLVELYASLPAEMGGDREKAGQIALSLNKKDKVWGAMANARLMPDNGDFVSFWQQIQKEEGNNIQVSEELGRAYLLNSDTENGTKCFLEVVHADNAKRYLYMNLVRYHIMSTQQNPDATKEHLDEAEKLANLYLQSNPGLVAPMKAHAYGILGLIRMIGGDKEGSDKFRQMAVSTDPYYSRATGVPSEMLYCQPGDVKILYSSFFMPF